MATESEEFFSEDEENSENGKDAENNDKNSDSSFTARLARVVRTESSEVYLIWQENTRIGQVDLHFGWDLIHATLILERDLTPEQQADLVDLIDQDVVSSHLPRFSREDFLVTVFRAQELEPFSDGPTEEDFDDEDEY